MSKCTYCKCLNIRLRGRLQCPLLSETFTKLAEPVLSRECSALPCRTCRTLSFLMLSCPNLSCLTPVLPDLLILPYPTSPTLAVLSNRDLLSWSLGPFPCVLSGMSPSLFTTVALLCLRGPSLQRLSYWVPIACPCLALSRLSCPDLSHSRLSCPRLVSVLPWLSQPCPCSALPVPSRPCPALPVLSRPCPALPNPALPLSRLACPCLAPVPPCLSLPCPCPALPVPALLLSRLACPRLTPFLPCMSLPCPCPALLVPVLLLSRLACPCFTLSRLACPCLAPVPPCLSLPCFCPALPVPALPNPALPLSRLAPVPPCLSLLYMSLLCLLHCSYLASHGQGCLWFARNCIVCPCLALPLLSLPCLSLSFLSFLFLFLHLYNSSPHPVSIMHDWPVP
jgi:hypothetical protein